MVLRFTNKQEPSSHDQLTELQRQQLVAAGKLWDGRDLPAEARLSEDAPADFEDPNFSGLFEIWDVLDDQGEVIYTTLIYKVDSGSFFKAGTTDEVAEVIQFYLSCEDEELFAAVIDALELAKEQGVDCPRISYRR